MFKEPSIAHKFTAISNEPGLDYRVGQLEIELCKLKHEIEKKEEQEQFCKMKHLCFHIRQGQPKLHCLGTNVVYCELLERIDPTKCVIEKVSSCMICELRNVTVCHAPLGDIRHCKNIQAGCGCPNMPKECEARLNDIHG